MRTISILVLTLLLVFHVNVYGQDKMDCNCCEGAYLNFDFWEGDWTVTDSIGKVVGFNDVKKLQNGCILQENWKSNGSLFNGSSYNYYNASDSSWHQVWVDNTGYVLNLEGNLVDNAMTLQSEILTGKDGKKYRHQIKWTPSQDGTVLQEWNILNKEGEEIKLVFSGLYTKTEQK